MAGEFVCLLLVLGFAAPFVWVYLWFRRDKRYVEQVTIELGRSFPEVFEGQNFWYLINYRTTDPRPEKGEGPEPKRGRKQPDLGILVLKPNRLVLLLVHQKGVFFEENLDYEELDTFLIQSLGENGHTNWIGLEQGSTRYFVSACNKGMSSKGKESTMKQFNQLVWARQEYMKINEGVKVV